MTDYSQYRHLVVEKQNGIALLTTNRPGVLNATNAKLHNELSRIWLDLGDDAEVRVAVITGSGSAFPAAGDFEMIEQAIGNADAVAATMQEAGDIVHNMINLDKPVVSAINGVAVGGLPGDGFIGRYLDSRRRRPHHRRPHALGSGRRRPRGGDLTAAVRHGQG